MGIGFQEMLLIGAIVFLIFFPWRGFDIRDLFALAYKYQGARVRTRVSAPHVSMFIIVAIVIAAAAVVFAAAISAN